MMNITEIHDELLFQVTETTTPIQHLKTSIPISWNVSLDVLNYCGKILGC